MNTSTTRHRAHLVLADGTVFEGFAYGHDATVTGEVVFTTGMTGYQEVLTDPSYHNQLVTMTAPHIGNTGVNLEDEEADKPMVGGFIFHEPSPGYSNWRAETSLDAYLETNHVTAIVGIDTRALTRHIRDHGAQMAAIGAEPVSVLADKAKAAPSIEGQNLARFVSTPTAYMWTEARTAQHKTCDLGVWHTGVWTDAQRQKAKGLKVTALDFGTKHGIFRCFNDLGVEVTVMPWNTPADKVLATNPDGIFLSNGPGDPAAVTEGITAVRDLLGKKPIFGICLGHQLLALALGGTTYPLKFGHRGLNQPVQDLSTKRVEITTQNHGFVVDVPSLEGKCTLTHIHLNDGTCEGIEHREANAFSVQYHPEANGGTHDSRYLFERFIERIAQR